MKRSILLLQLFLMSAVMGFAQETPVSQNGQLQLVGNQLSNECGDPVQLTGMSTHGVMFHSDCYSESSVEALATDWESDLIRLAIYTESSGGTDGYIDGDRDHWHSWIDQMVDYAEDQGIYVVIDWHTLDDNDPNTHKSAAQDFFELMSQRYADRNHVIYEICNEPNSGVNWGTIKSYAQDVIPTIRANDSEGIILVGTPGYSSDVWAAANDPLTGDNAHNVMYTYHFYAGTHYGDRRDHLRTVASEVPVFVSEWGTVSASGGGGVDQGSADAWLSILDGNNNGGVTISSANWSFVDKDEGASALTPNACTENNWSSRTTSGNYIYNYLTQADNFNQCDAAGDDDGDGVTNGNDECPGTEPGTTVDDQGCATLQGDADNDGVIDADDSCANTASDVEVNIYGCEIVNDFVSNVCMGFNNKQGYARTDFEQYYANIDFWNAPDEDNPVYSAERENGELAIDVTDGDPDYATQGFSFGETYEYNGSDYDTSLLPLDVRANPVVQMDVYFEPASGYSQDYVMVEIHLEDTAGNKVNTDALQEVTRQYVSTGSWETISFNFRNGYHEEYDDDGNASYSQDIDFSSIHKVLMWVNPDADADWHQQTINPYNGTWRIDNFSIGYDTDDTEDCNEIRDDDGDGVRIEDDTCANTPPDADVDEDGCADFQRDDDGDGIMNPDDVCPDTEDMTGLDDRGCSDAQDSDHDGVMNENDSCANTPEGASVDAEGCAASQLDDDNDGVTNDQDECPDTEAGTEVDDVGCPVTGVINKVNSNLKVYPVPAEDKITIVQEPKAFDRAEVLDVNGVVVKRAELDAGTQQLSLNKLPKGVYIVKLSGAESVETVRIMIK